METRDNRKSGKSDSQGRAVGEPPSFAPAQSDASQLQQTGAAAGGADYPHPDYPHPDYPHHWSVVIDELAAVIEQRKGADAAGSWTAKLLHGAEDSLLKKVVEEAAEVALAAKGGDRARLNEEMADLLFHCLVVLSRYNSGVEEVSAVLAKRRGVSGLAEKSSRKT